MLLLQVPPLIRVTDRLTVLDLLYNLGCPHGHQATNLKLKLFETQNISIGTTISSLARSQGL